eukprot:356757-Pleurochrysis_carterae.AAC.1
MLSAAASQANRRREQLTLALTCNPAPAESLPLSHTLTHRTLMLGLAMCPPHPTPGRPVCTVAVQGD